MYIVWSEINDDYYRNKKGFIGNKYQIQILYVNKISIKLYILYKLKAFV